MPRHDSDVAHIFGGRTWGEHNAIKRKQKGAPSRPCACLHEDCRDVWLECWGEKNVPHIRRCSEEKGLSSGSCGMTVDHANAQACVAGLLEMGKEIGIKRECITCGELCISGIKLSEGEECRPEAFFRNERRNFADLGIVPRGAERGARPTTIIEILHSSKTLEGNRPNDIPWFEIKAEDVNSQALLLATNPSHGFEFKCQREIECDYCINIGPFVDWIRAQDKGTPHDMWNRQYYSKCILCESFCEHTYQMDPALYTFRSDEMLNFFYARHRLCWTHSLKRTEARGAMTPCEFFADATVLYAKRREQFEEAKRVAAEVKRVAAEIERVAAEVKRVAAVEATRREQFEEAKRVAAEVERVAAEVERVAAETKRIAAVEATRAERANVFRQSVVAKMYARREQKSKRKLHRLDKSVNMKRICTKLICSSAAIPCVVSAPQTVLYSALLQLGKVRPEQHVSGFYR
jgi:hypothetical protein